MSGKRAAMSLVGNLLLGIGVAVFKFSAMGNDPYNGMNMALADRFGIPYPTVQILVNLVFFAVQLLWGRDLIGFGTLVNTFLLGYVVNAGYFALCRLFPAPHLFIIQVLVMLAGMLILCLGLSFYQTSEMGTSPYDSFSLILTRKLEKAPYFWCRIFGDAACALVCFLAGGLVGLGTLVSAFCLGPVIAFFDRTVSRKLV
ncbi:MAG: hypothetical protein K6E30_01620 [Lachnospiraceae bacterium]|nr:hypothetical protein [Lachnospiraceae bacterium]